MIAPVTLTPRARAFLAFLAKAVVGGLLLGLVIAAIPLGDALSVAVTLDPTVMAVVVALYFLAHLVNAAKLQVFLPRLSLWQAWRFTMIGVLYGTALPGQIAGDAVKAVRLARVQGAGAAVAAVAVDKIVGVFALLLLVALAVGLDVQRFAGAPGLIVMAVVMTVAVTAAMAVVFFLPVPSWLGRFGESIAAWRSISIRPAALSYALLLGLVFQSLCIAIFAALGPNLNVVLPVSGWAIVMGFSSIVLLAPITVAGLGVREASIIGAVVFLGGSEVGAFAISLVLFVLTLIGAAVGLAVDLADRDRNASRKS